MSSHSIPFVFLQAFLLGTNMLLSRYALEQFHPLAFVGMRFVVAGLFTVLVYILVSRRNRPWPKDRRLWIHASIFGIVGSVLPMTLVVWSLQYQSSGVSSVLVTVVPALTVVLAHFFLPDESINQRKALGVVLAFAGALVLTLRGETGLTDVTQADPLGYALVFIAVIAASCMIVYARRYIQGYDTFDVTSIQIISSTIFILPVVVFTVGLDLHQVNTGGLIALLISATAGTFGVVFVGYYIIDRFGATAASMSSYVVPIIVAIGGVLFLEEQITAGILAGFVCIIAGLGLINEFNSDRDLAKSA